MTTGTDSVKSALNTLAYIAGVFGGIGLGVLFSLLDTTTTNSTDSFINAGFVIAFGFGLSVVFMLLSKRLDPNNEADSS